MWRRIELRLAGGVVVRFSDREKGLRQLDEIAERGRGHPIVVYGPEGCGKTAFFRQAIEILRSHGYSVVYLNPTAEESERIITTEDLRELAREVAGALHPVLRVVVDKAIDIVSRALKAGRKRIAVILDDIFQAAGLERAEIYVKMLLNMIEYPPADYEKIVAIVGSSEGVTRYRVGRHNWAYIYMIWNMSREGFRELYEQIPRPKPDFDTVWNLTGGNPRYLGELYQFGWDADGVIDSIIEKRGLRGLVSSLTPDQLNVLRDAVEDPDALDRRLREASTTRAKNRILGLIKKLVELNLLIEYIPQRREYHWIDTPPPEKDPLLGIGSINTWQTPLHREAVRRALERTR